MKVFVFGGTGFIGSRIVASLVRSGHTVSALARSQGKTDFLRKLGASPHFGDLEQLQTIRGAIKGSEVIVSAAFPQ